MPRRTTARSELDALKGRVDTLEATLARLTEERDQALAELAAARATASALRLALQRDPEPEPTLYPTGTGLDGPPLRYRVADSVNESLKSVLGPLHRISRTLVSRLGR